MTQDIVDYGFGKQYHGLHTVWKMQFSIEHSEVLSDLSQLLNDCNGIPIYTGLEETAEINSKCFETVDSTLVNLCVKKYTG